MKSAGKHPPKSPFKGGPKGLRLTAAMDAIPHPIVDLDTKEGKDGSVTVKIRLQSTKWQRWFGGPPEYHRQYVLDALGREVLEACNGRASVREIVAGFARDHNVSVPEAEIAVTTYLKTLMAKGVIGMEVGGTSQSPVDRRSREGCGRG